MIQYNLALAATGSRHGTDGRGKKQPWNKTVDETEQAVIDHINSFPIMESHYSRKDSAKKYLAHDLNIRKMWQLYKIECEKNGVKNVQEGKYQQIFCEKFNLAFFKPKERPMLNV